MRTATPMLAALLALCVLPVGDATHETSTHASIDSNARVVAYFEFDHTAARPPADLEGVLVLESRSQAVTINGSITIIRSLAEALELANDANEPENEGETLGGRSELLERVDVDLDSFSSVRIPFSVPIRGLGHGIVEFEAELLEDGRVRAGQAFVYGVAPVEVTLDSPAPDAQLVSVPGRPAEVTLTLTALPGSNLTDLRLSQEGLVDFTETIEIGDLAAGESFTAILVQPADLFGSLRFRSVLHSAIIPQLHGFSDGEDFSHPLYRSDGDRLEPIHPAVYIAPESTLFLIPPQEPRLRESTMLDVVVLNAGTKALHASGQVTLSLPGMPHLDTTFDVDARVEAGGVETVTLDWTPPAAGPWQATVRHDLGKREPQVEQIHVSGPIAGVDFQVPAALLERGKPVTVSVVLTASETVDVEGLRITMPRAPLKGIISVNDLFVVRPVQDTTSLQPQSPDTLELALTPKATGQHDVYLVVETPEGPSVHSVGTLTVTGSTGGWPLAWSPTLLVGLLVGLHMSWRRWWVT